MGYVSQELAVKVASGQTLSVPTIILKSKSQRLDGVEVTGEGSLVPTKETEYVARMPLANIENPQVYNVVSSKLLEKQGVVDYKTAMTNVAGISMGVQASNGSLIFGSRGFRTHSTVRNGMPIQLYSDRDIANIERVEVIKGPTGTLFGGGGWSSYGALVNQVTKKPHQEFETDLTYNIGSWGFNRLTADVNTPLKKDGSVLLRNNLAFQTANTWQDAGYHNRIFYAPSLTYKANERLTLSLDADIYQYKGTPTPLILVGNIPGVKSFDDLKKFDHKVTFSSNEVYFDNFAANAFFKAEYQLSNNWKSTTLVNYGKNGFRSNYSFARIISQDEANLTLFMRRIELTNQQIQQNFNGEFKLAGLRHRILAGLDYWSSAGTYTFGSRFSLKLPLQGPRLAVTREGISASFAEGEKTKKPENREAKSRTYSVYLSDVIDFTDQLHLLLSLRLDRFDSDGRTNFTTNKTSGAYQQTALAPRLGLVYELLPKQLSLFANYNRGFTNRAGTDVKGNTFVPEKANQMEGGLKWEPKSKMANITLSYYHIEVEDMVRPDLNNPNFSIQDGNVRSSGFELDAALNPAEGLSLIAGYAYNDARIIKGRNPELNGNRPRNTPQHLANFFASYTFSGALKGLDIGFGGNYGSESFSGDDNRFIINSYTILNANMGYSVGKVRFNIRAENLTGEKYMNEVGQAQAPLRVLGSVSMRF